MLSNEGVFIMRRGCESKLRPEASAPHLKVMTVSSRSTQVRTCSSCHYVISSQNQGPEIIHAHSRLHTTTTTMWNLTHTHNSHHIQKTYSAYYSTDISTMSVDSLLKSLSSTVIFSVVPIFLPTLAGWNPVSNKEISNPWLKPKWRIEQNSCLIRILTTKMHWDYFPYIGGMRPQLATGDQQVVAGEPQVAVGWFGLALTGWQVASRDPQRQQQANRQQLQTLRLQQEVHKFQQETYKMQ